MIGIAAIALVAIAAYATQLGFHERLARFGLSLILGGAFGNLIDRAVAGYVVDFVDVYWGDVSLLGVQRRGRRHHHRGRARAARHDRPRTTACIPFCLRSAGFPVYTYGLLLAAAYLLGLQFALVRAPGARSRSRTGSWISASGSSSARSSAPSCSC